MAKNALDIFGIKRSLHGRVFTVLCIVLILLIIYNTTPRKIADSRLSRTRAVEPLADRLYKEVRIMCMVITTPKNHDTRAVYVLRTWGRHCNKILFLSTDEHEELESVDLNVKDEPEQVWGKVKAAFDYVYRYHAHEADWFLKVEDDTFVILENLRYALYPYDSEMPIYFGCKINPITEQSSIMSGGAGYVLSKEAMRRFVTKAMPNTMFCRQDSEGAENVEMSRCLQNVGVLAADTRAKDGNTFFPFSPIEHLTGISKDHSWYLDIAGYRNHNGSERISRHAISFHNLDLGGMYNLEFLVHTLRLFGLKRQPVALKRKLSMKEFKLMYRSQAP